MMACLKAPGLTPTERIALAVLAYHDGPGGSYISDETLGREAGIKHRSSVRKARNELRKKGWLWWKRGKHTNRYELAYGRPFESHWPENSASPHWPENSASDKATLAEKCAPHWPENSAINRKEPERSTSGAAASLAAASRSGAVAPSTTTQSSTILTVDDRRSTACERASGEIRLCAAPADSPPAHVDDSQEGNGDDQPRKAGSHEGDIVPQLYSPERFDKYAWPLHLAVEDVRYKRRQKALDHERAAKARDDAGGVPDPAEGST